MKFLKFCAFLLAIVAVGGFAERQPNISFQSNYFNRINKAFRSSLPVVDAHIQTSVIENPTVNFPDFIPPTTISESCHCLNTLVRPQIRNEIITVPTADRIIHTVASPIVETIKYGGDTRLAIFTQAKNNLPGNTRTRNSFAGIQENTFGTSRSNSEFYNDDIAGGVLSTGQNTNSLNGAASANGVNVDVIAMPSVFKFQNPTARIINTSL